MRKQQTLFMTFLVLGLLLWAGLVQAQDPIKLKNITIELWPEFDQPETLVIYRVELADTTAFPTQVTLHFPDYIEDMHAIATEQNGGLFNLAEESIQRSQSGGKTDLTLTVESPLIHLEYYDPQMLKFDGEARQIDYTFTTDYSIEKAVLQIQQPVQAENFKVTPQPTGQFTAANGLSFQAIEAAGLVPGESLTLQARYSRPTTEPSINLLNNTPEHAADIQVVTETPASTTEIPWGYILVGVGVLLLLGTAGYWWWSTRMASARVSAGPAPRSARQTPRSAAKAPRRPPAPAAKSSGSAGYCPQCGTALRPESNFCHVCGTPRRQG